MPLYEAVCLVRTHDVARRHLSELVAKVRGEAPRAAPAAPPSAAFAPGARAGGGVSRGLRRAAARGGDAAARCACEGGRRSAVCRARACAWLCAPHAPQQQQREKERAYPLSSAADGEGGSPVGSIAGGVGVEGRQGAWRGDVP